MGPGKSKVFGSGFAIGWLCGMPILARVSGRRGGLYREASGDRGVPYYVCYAIKAKGSHRNASLYNVAAPGISVVTAWPKLTVVTTLADFEPE